MNRNITTDQRAAMVAFIRENPGCNTGKFEGPHSEQLKQQTWDKLAEILNSMPGPNNNGAAWRKSFQDWKYECKQKHQFNARHKNDTGNKIKLRPINDLEQICIKEFFTKSQLEGNGTVDPDRDVVEEQCTTPNSNVLEGRGLHLHNLEISADTAVQFIVSDSTDTVLEVSSPAACSTPSSSRPQQKSKRKKTDAEIRKEVTKRVRKEAELDVNRSEEMGQLQAHLDGTTKSADALASIAKSLESMAQTQREILIAQKLSNEYLHKLLEL